MATPSYFRERARNPHLRRPPGLEEDPRISPTFDQPMPPGVAAPQPLEVAGAPRATAPPVTPPLARDPLATAYEGYAADVPTTTGGRILEALKTAGIGALQGVARNPQGGLGAAIGGAAAGGVMSAVSPRAGRALQFGTIEQPRIEGEMQRAEVQRKKQEEQEDRARGISMDALKRRQIETGIKADEATTRARRFETVPYGAGVLDTESGELTPGQPRAEAPEFGATGGAIYNKRTGEVTTPAPPRQSRPPEASYAQAQEAQEMKRAAIANWAKVDQLPAGSPERQQAEAVAAQSQAAYNQYVKEFGERFGEWYEVGGFTEPSGNQGWAYWKPHQAGTRPQTPGAKPMQGGAKGQPTANLADLEKLWR